MACISQFCYLPNTDSIWTDDTNMERAKTFYNSWWEIVIRWGPHTHKPPSRNRATGFCKRKTFTVAWARGGKVLTGPQLDPGSDPWLSGNARWPCPHCKTRRRRRMIIRHRPFPAPMATGGTQKAGLPAAGTDADWVSVDVGSCRIQTSDIWLPRHDFLTYIFYDVFI